MLVPFKGIKRSKVTGIYYKFVGGRLMRWSAQYREWEPSEFKNHEGNMKRWVKVKSSEAPR
jgi:hypothetical protein